MTWAWQLTHGKDEPIHGVTAYENEALLVADVRKAVDEGKAKAGHLPRVLVIGALGRCGRGAVDLCAKAGLDNILVRKKPHQCMTFHLANKHDTTEMGPPRNSSPTGTLPRNHRIRCLRKLHLPLRQNPTLHRPSLPLNPIPQTQRRLRRILRHNEPSQPNPNLRCQHHIRSSHSTCQTTKWFERTAIECD